MRIINVEIPNFRSLKNVDISFEKEDAMDIFSLYSNRNNGKSIFLQLLFLLLHCNNEDQLPYLMHMVNIENMTSKDDEIIASIELQYNTTRFTFKATAIKNSGTIEFTLIPLSLPRP